jgi:hypothetical protein
MLCKTTAYSDSDDDGQAAEPLTHSAHLLDDLESIRELLGDANLQPPLLTETVEQIPLLLDEPAGARRSPRRQPLRPPRMPRPAARTPCCTWTPNCVPPPRRSCRT